MTKREFRKLANERGLYGWTKGYAACELVLVKGLTATAAAKKVGICVTSVTRPLKKLTSGVAEEASR